MGSYESRLAASAYEFGLSLRGRYAYADLPLVGAVHIVFNREFLPPPTEHRYVTFETDHRERRLCLGRHLLLSWAPPAKPA